MHFVLEVFGESVLEVNHLSMFASWRKGDKSPIKCYHIFCELAGLSYL